MRRPRARRDPDAVEDPARRPGARRARTDRVVVPPGTRAAPSPTSRPRAARSTRRTARPATASAPTGTENGPSLQGVGPASVDFMLRTGRMPLANPADQPVRGEPKFTPGQIEALIAYVASIAPGGEPIPTVDTSAGDLALGAEVFLNDCAACHGAGASGDSVGGGQIAPSLYPADPTEIGEAVRIGPGLMPRFGPETIDQHELDSLAAYLRVAPRQRRRGRAAARPRGRRGRGARRGRGGSRHPDPGAPAHGGEAMKRAERAAASPSSSRSCRRSRCFVVYVRGGNPQAEGALLALALGGVGAGLLIWATRLMPHIRDETQPRSKTAARHRGRSRGGGRDDGSRRRGDPATAIPVAAVARRGRGARPRRADPDPLARTLARRLAPAHEVDRRARVSSSPTVRRSRPRPWRSARSRPSSPRGSRARPTRRRY